MAELRVRLTGVVVDSQSSEYDFFDPQGNRVQGISRKVIIQNGKASMVEVKIPRQLTGSTPPEGTQVDLDVQPIATNAGKVVLNLIGDHQPYEPFGSGK